MNIETHERKKSPFLVLFLIIIMSGFSLYIIIGLQDSSRIYKDIQSELTKTVYSGSVGRIEFPETKGSLNIPNWNIFLPGQPWALVSSKTPLKANFVPQNLIDLTLAHGDSTQSMKIQSTIKTPLASLFSGSETAGHPLMVSSAYRSIAEQKALYELFVQNKGQASADMYVAHPGESEHHTGLAVDLSNVSTSCGLNSDRCSLDFTTSQWLDENAYRYGFVQRYPEGKQPITGISYEAWHYRYVGIPLAAKIHASNLTLDEALTQMYPAFSR